MRHILLALGLLLLASCASGTFGIRDMEERVDRVVALACHEAAAL